MKKSKFLLVAFAVTIGLSSCKKNYECCYFNAEGEKIEEGLFICGDIGMKKNDVEDLEVRMNDAAAEWNGTAKCELNIEAK